jgi:hypothetical protein
MDKERYLPPVNGGRWAISREVEGQWVALIENTPPFYPSDILTVLVVLAIEPTQENLDYYFPIRGERGRCPTLDLLELFSELGSKSGSQIGV